MGRLSGLSLFTSSYDFAMHVVNPEEMSFDVSELIEGLSFLTVQLPTATGTSTFSRKLLLSQKRISVPDVRAIVQSTISKPIGRSTTGVPINLILRFIPVDPTEHFSFTAFDTTKRNQALSKVFSDPGSYSKDTFCVIPVNSEAITESINCFKLDAGEYVVLMGVEINHNEGISFTLNRLDMFFTEDVTLKPNIISVDRELIPNIDFAHSDTTLDYGISCVEDLEVDGQTVKQFVPEKELLGGDNIFSHRDLTNYSNLKWNTNLNPSTDVIPYYTLDNHYSGTGEPSPSLKGSGKRYLNTSEKVIYSYNSYGNWVTEPARKFRIIKFKDDPEKRYFLNNNDGDNGLIEYNDQLDTLGNRFKEKFSGTPMPYSFIHGDLSSPRTMYRYNLPDGEIMPEKLILFVARADEILNPSVIFEVRDQNNKLVFSQEMDRNYTAILADYNGIVPLSLPVVPLEYSLSNQASALPKILEIIKNNIAATFSVSIKSLGGNNASYHRGSFYIYFCNAIARNIKIS